MKDTYYPTNSLEKISDLCFSADTIFALTPSKLLSGLINNPALTDQSQWSIDNRLPYIAGSTFTEIEIMNSDLIVLIKVDGPNGDEVVKLSEPINVVISNFPWAAKINSINVRYKSKALKKKKNTINIKNKIE